MTPIGWDLCDENCEIEGLNRSKYGNADIADWDFMVSSVKKAKTNAKIAVECRIMNSFKCGESKKNSGAQGGPGLEMGWLSQWVAS